MTLLVITVLVGLVVGFSEETGVDLQLAGYHADGSRAYHLGRSAVHVGLAA